MTSNDPIAAALQELASHHEQLTQLDARETDHFTALTRRLSELTDLITGLGHSLEDDTTVLARFEALDRQVTGLAAQIAPPSTGPDGYHPDPAPAWWKLAAADRQEPITQLRAWVEQVYRPGYGHLAAALGPCWPSHDLCLYGLDILSQVWSALYLQPERTAELLSAQAEYQARLLPALAEQLRAETNRCGHPRTAAPIPGQPGARHDGRHPPPGPCLRPARLAGVPVPAGGEDSRHPARLPRRHHRPAADHRLVRPRPRLEPCHRHRRPRPRRP